MSIKSIATRIKMKKCHYKLGFERHFVYFYRLTKTLSGINSCYLLLFYLNFNIFDIP